MRPGRSYLLGSQLQSYALAVSLCFVGVLLAAGAIALERDENVIGRLSRGLAGPARADRREDLLTAIASIVLGGLLAIAFGVAVSVQGAGGGQPWSRLPLLVPALAAAGAAIGALGVLVGTLARELRTAAILALALVLPMIFLGIVPHELSPTAATVSDAFPFAPSAHVFSDVLFVSAPLGGLASGLAHLALLTLVFGGAARLAARRLDLTAQRRPQHDDARRCDRAARRRARARAPAPAARPPPALGCEHVQCPRGRSAARSASGPRPQRRRAPRTSAWSNISKRESSASRPRSAGHLTSSQSANGSSANTRKPGIARELAAHDARRLRAARCSRTPSARRRRCATIASTRQTGDDQRDARRRPSRARRRPPASGRSRSSAPGSTTSQASAAQSSERIAREAPRA